VTQAVQRRGERLALAVISIGQMMFLIDATIVNIALPAIRASLGFSGAVLEWVVTGYSLAYGGLLLLGGRAGDILGRRKLFVTGLAVFTTASLVGGLAWTPWVLLACRAAQGAGAAAASPAVLSLVATTFPEGPRRERAVGVYTSVVTSGGGLGLLAGGVIVTFLSWRWVMFVNVPIGLLVLACAPRVLVETEPGRGRFDLAGALSATAGVSLLVYGLIAASADESGRMHFTDPVVLLAFGAAVLCLVAFVVVERRSPNPLVPLRIFADRARWGSYLVVVLFSTVMFGMFFFLTLFQRQVWGEGPLRVALGYLPLTAVLACAKFTRRLLPVFGARRVVLAGLTVAAAGLVWLSRIGATGDYWTGLLLPSVLTYAGIGVLGVPLTLNALSGVANSDLGIASGLYTAARQIGGATGLAVLGTVAWASAAAVHPGSPGDPHALTVGVTNGLLTAAGLMLLALAVAWRVIPAERARCRAASAGPGRAGSSPPRPARPRPPAGRES